MGVSSGNVRDRATVYQFRDGSLGQDFDAPYVPVGGSGSAANVSTVWWSDDDVDIKYISNLYSNVDNPYWNDTYSEVITFTHSGEWAADAKPDLNINMSLQGGNEAVPGDVIPFTINVANSGNRYSGSDYRGRGNVALWRSTDDDFDTGYGSEDIALINASNDFYELPFLLPSGTASFTGNLVMPSESGTYYFTAFVDAGEDVTESNENNNQGQVFVITVGDAQATADVTYPSVGENTDISELNDKGYIEITYSDANPASINGDEIQVSGVGAGNISIGNMTKVDDDTYRYQVNGNYQVGLVDVQVVADSFTNNSNQANAGETKSFGALPDLSPLQLSADTKTFNWDAAKKQFKYSGNFGIGLKPPDGQQFSPILDANGEVGFDGTKLSFTGMVSMQLYGQETTLLDGGFEFDLGSMFTSGLNQAAGQVPKEFTVAGAKLKLTKIEFAIPQGKTVADTQLELQGSITLPEDMGGFDLSITDPHKLIVSPTAGVSLSGGTLKLPDLEIFMFGGEVKMVAKDMSVEYIAEVTGEKPKPAALRFRGSVNLPYFYNATANFTGSDSYIEVTRLGGVDWYGTLSVEDIVIVPGQWEINKALLGMKKDEHDNYKTECEAKMTLPTGIALGGKVHFINGDINFLELEADNVNKPLGTTGAFLQRIVAHVDHLSEYEVPDQPVSMGGTLGITAGPQVTVPLPSWIGLGDKVEGVLVGLELSADVDENHLTGHGYVEIVSGLVQGNANAELNWQHGTFSASADLDALQGLITAQASLFVDYSEAFQTTDITAAGSAAVTIPKVIPLWGGVQLGSANMKLQYLDDNKDDNDYVMGWGKIRVSEYASYYLTGGIKVGFDGSYSFVGGKEIVKLTAPTSMANSIAAVKAGPARQLGPLETTSTSADYVVEPDTPWLLMGADWEESNNSVTVEVVDPQGNTYTEDDFDGSGNIVIVDSMLDDKGRAVYVNEPAPGTWSIRFVSASELPEMTITSLAQDSLPGIAITDVEVDGRGQEVTVDYTADWSDENTVINVYYDTDNQDADGFQFAADIVPQAAGSVPWDTSSVPAGNYYVYAEIVDSTNAPITVYWPGPITIEEVPVGVEVPIGDGLASAVTYLDSDGSSVSVRLAGGKGMLSFTGENVETEQGKKGVQVTGEGLTLAALDISSSGNSTSLTVTAKGGSTAGTTMGEITGGSLARISGKGLTLIDDITLSGSLGAVAVDDIGPNVTITSGAPAAGGFSLKADAIADAVTFDLAGAVSSFQANTFTGGSLTADRITKLGIKQGGLGAAVTARVGDIVSLSALGDIAGNLSASGSMVKIASKSGDVTGTVRAAVDIGSLQAVDLDHAIISAGRDIKKLSLKGNIADAYVLAGCDIGADLVFGGDDDSLDGGDILSVAAKGTFARSYMAAGTIPNTPLTNLLANVGEDAAQGGSINRVKFSAIDYSNGGNEFGLYAATGISPFKVGKNMAQPQGDFTI